MRALVLVAFFLFLRISILVPYKLSDVANPQACPLRPSNVIFTSQGALLRITHTKTIQFHERQLEIPLPCSLGSHLCLMTVLQQYLASISYHLALFYSFINYRALIGLSWLNSIKHSLRHRSQLLTSTWWTFPRIAVVEMVRHLLSAVKHRQHLLKHKATERVMLI